MIDRGPIETTPQGSLNSEFEELLQSIDGIIWEADPETFQFTFVSEKALEILGHPLDYWYTNTNFWADTIHPEDCDWVTEFCVSATKKREDHQFEYRMIHADGRTVWLRDIVSIAESKSIPGKMMLRGVMFDITEQKQTEAELEISQERLQATLVNTPNVSIQWFDEEGVVQFWNPASEAMFGWTAEEALGKTLDQTIHTPEENAAFLNILSKISSTGKPVGPNEYQFRRKDGSIGFCSSTIFPIPGQSGRPFFVCMDVDVTERRQAEDDRKKLVSNLGERVKELSALHAVAGLFQDSARPLTEIIRDVAAIVPSAMQEPELANARVRLGTCEEETDGFSPSGNLISAAFVTSDEIHGFVEAIYTERTESGETPPTFLDEERSLIETIAEMLRVYYDRRVSDENLRKSEQRFRQLAENIREVFWIHSPGINEMVYVSPAYETVWGRSCESLYADPPSFLNAIFPEDLDRVLSQVNNGPTTGFEVEYRINRPDGTMRWIWDQGFPVRDESGKVYRVAGIAEDITDRKSLEEKLLQARKMEAVGQLAGGVAHDFNNLLTAIIGYSELILRKTERSNPLTKYVEEIRKSGNRAANLTSQLLAFSRKQIFQPKMIDLNLVVVEIEQIIRRLIGENIRLQTKLDPRACRVMADPGQIEQVIVNLAVNASESMKTGGTLTFSTHRFSFNEETASKVGLDTGTEYISLVVADTGTGISPEHLDKIYEPFFTTKEVGKGSGLGLSTVYGIVQQSGGKIGVETSTEHGTLFTIYLPEVGERNESKIDEPTWTTFESATETILLVEDEAVVRNMIEQMLKVDGYEVIAAKNGAEAISLVEASSSPIDIMITDVVMPEISGPELVLRVKETYPDIRVLFMSGYIDDDIFPPDHDLDNTHFIQKPFNPSIFAEKVRSILDSRQMEIQTRA